MEDRGREEERERVNEFEDSEVEKVKGRPVRETDVTSGLQTLGPRVRVVQRVVP